MIGAVLDGPRGRYQVLEEIGRGGFGVTFRGQMVGGDVDARPVVIKALPLRGLPGWKAVELFEREAAALHALAHPGIPAWVDDFVLGGTEAPRGFVLVMELVPGRTLRQIVAAGGLSREALLDVAGDVLGVLDHIHQRTPPLIHRDVNPKNILVRPDGRAMLVDFGSVQAALRGPAQAGHTAAGTFGYAPLEQFLGQATPQSDLYGLGMTLLAALSGKEPEALPLRGIAVDVAAVVPGDPRLVRLIEAMVEPDPRRRLGSAGEALALLRPLRAAGVPAGVRATVPTVRPPAAPAVDALERLARRLGARGFAIERGGELGQTALAWRARHDGKGIPGGPVQVTAVSAAALGAINRPLPPIPAALFVQAVAGVDIESGGGLRGWLDGKPLAIPMIGLGEHGVDARAREHVVHSLRESEQRVVIPALLSPDTAIEVLTPRSLLAGDSEGHLDRVRRLLAPVD
jgi:Protein kinase domain